MILTLDVGNTNIKCAIFNGEEMRNYWRLSTDQHRTRDEYGMVLMEMLARANISVQSIEGVIVSSVVPSVNFTIEHMCQEYFGHTPIMVRADMETGMRFLYENPRSLGSDRVANAVAAWHIYGGPCIFIDFGSATTFGAVDSAGAFLGGAISPGIRLSAEALVAGASKLPRIELALPETVIGRDTITNMQSGLIHGYVGLVRYMVGRMKEEIRDENARVIATGGLALLIAKESGVIDELDGLLTLKGLRILYEKNRNGAN